MAENEIAAKAAPALEECPTAMTSLKKLSVAENKFKDDGAMIIDKTLEDSHTDLKELDVSKNMLQRVGARRLAVRNKLDFVLLNINGNFISDEGVDEVKKILNVLSSLDEKEPEGESEEDYEEDIEGNERGLDWKLQNLEG